jgi:hypothetical protein
VLEQIERGTLLTSKQVDCLLQCTSTPIDTLRKYIASGEVVFGKSDTRKEPCPIYHIETHYEATPITIRVESCRDTSTVLEINGSLTDCPCP